MRAGRRPRGRCKARRSCGSRSASSASSRCSRASRCRRCRASRTSSQPSYRRRLADRERLLPRRAAARARGLLLGAVARSRSASGRARASRAARTGSPSSLSIALLVWAAAGGSSAASTRSSAASLRTRELAALLLGFASAHGAARDAASPRASSGRGSTGSALTLWPIAALLRRRRVACGRASRRGFRLARVAGRRSARCSGSCARARQRFPRLAGALHVDGLLARRGSARCGKRTGSSTRAADGVWPEAAVLALGAALRSRDAARDDGRRVAVRRARARLRASRLRRRARGADSAARSR